MSNNRNPLEAIKALGMQSRLSARGKKSSGEAVKSAQNMKEKTEQQGKEKQHKQEVKQGKPKQQSKPEQSGTQKNQNKPKAQNNSAVKDNNSVKEKNKTQNNNKAATNSRHKPQAAEKAGDKAKTQSKTQSKTQGKTQGKTDSRGKIQNQTGPQSKSGSQIKVNEVSTPTAAKKPRASKRGGHNGSVRIIPLGGLEQIGMNMTAFETDDTIIIVDCGSGFPDETLPGVDLLIPNTDYLKEHESKIKGFVITHGHEDHIGGLPHVMKTLNVPVYGTRLTIALIKHKLEEARLLEGSSLNVVNYGQVLKFGGMSVEYVRTNHSIQDAAALAIDTPAGMVFVTGDFKVDYTPVFGDPIDLYRIAQIGHDGCRLLMCDSTNAIKSGTTLSEKTIGRRFDQIFQEHPSNRIIVSTFASNGDRVQQIIDTAYKYKRKVVIEGRSMVNLINTADELGYIKIPDGTLIDVDLLKKYKPEHTVIITTGSQGESMAALSRMAASTHKKVTITEDDVIILSSSPIPGNEKAISRIVNELTAKGAEVILSETHVSGHACEQDIRLMYSLVRPECSLPVHGEYRHLDAQREIALSMGLPEKNVILADNGDVAELTRDTFRIVDHVASGAMLVEGLGVSDMDGDSLIKDRQALSQNGIIIIAVCWDEAAGMFTGPAEVTTRGLVHDKDSEDFLKRLNNAVQSVMDSIENKQITDEKKIRSQIRESVNNFVWREMKKNPVIVPVVMNVN